MLIFKDPNTLIKKIKSSEIPQYSIIEYDITEINKSIQIIYEDFIKNELKEILKTEPKIYKFYFSEENENPIYFPISMVRLSPHNTREIYISYNLESLKDYPNLKELLDSKVDNLRKNIMDFWYDKLFNIGYLAHDKKV